MRYRHVLLSAIGLLLTAGVHAAMDASNLVLVQPSFAPSGTVMAEVFNRSKLPVTIRGGTLKISSTSGHADCAIQLPATAPIPPGGRRQIQLLGTAGFDSCMRGSNFRLAPYADRRAILNDQQFKDMQTRKVARGGGTFVAVDVNLAIEVRQQPAEVAMVLHVPTRAAH